MDVPLRSAGDQEELQRRIKTELNAKQRDRYRAALLAIQGHEAPRITQQLARSRRFVQRWAYEEKGDIHLFRRGLIRIAFDWALDPCLAAENHRRRFAGAVGGPDSGCHTERRRVPRVEPHRLRSGWAGGSGCW